MIYCKYVFTSLEDFTNLVKSVYGTEIENFNSFVNEEGSFVCLPHVPEVVGHHVDVIWHKEVNELFNSYEVFPEPAGLHTVMGMEGLYEHRYNEKMQSQAPE